MEHTLLPRNVERRQWVNRYYRIKVLSNVAEFNSSHACAKAQRWERCVRKKPSYYTRGFFFCKKMIKVVVKWTPARIYASCKNK